MAFLEIKNVRIAGMSAGVPAHIEYNDERSVHSNDYDAEAFVKSTGVRERRFSNEFTASDLCCAAAERLIADLGWEKSEVDALFFLSQNPDYISPPTACILQDRLGLSKGCYAIDMSMGCTGWVYGISSAASLISSSNGIKKAIFLCGEGRRICAKTNDPLFGHAGTATALEFCEGKRFVFDFGTDGSSYDAIIIPDGGARNQITSESLVERNVGGKMLCNLQPRMRGLDVFAFGINAAPASVRRLAEHFGFDYRDADYVVFHQANMKMNDMIVKKLKLPAEKVPSSMACFGNTSNATIPLTIVTQLKDKVFDGSRFICCGFGVGLSWATVAFTTDSLIVSELVEV